MTALSAVLRSLAQQMHDLGVATYQPSTGYAADIVLPGVVFGTMPNAPGNCVAINYYGTDPNIWTVQDNPLIRVQLAWRANSKSPLPVIDLAENGFRALHSMTPGLWPGGVRPLWMQRTISPPAERVDDRQIKADSYDIRLNPGV